MSALSSAPMRRLALFVLLVVAIACRKEAPPAQPAASTQPPQVTTAIATQDLANANVDTMIPIEARFIDRAYVGSKLAADGSVSDPQRRFASGEPIHLTMWLRESPAGLQTSARWLDASDKEVHRELRPMKGEKVVTFVLNKPGLKPGKYRVEGYWGGNIACDLPFEVTK